MQSSIKLMHSNHEKCTKALGDLKHLSMCNQIIIRKPYMTLYLKAQHKNSLSNSERTKSAIHLFYNYLLNL